MTLFLHFVAVNCVAVCLAAGQQSRGQARPAMGYELYSWQESKGGWEFQLLFNTNSEKSSKEVFNKKTALRGIGSLKRRISELPEGATIFWFDRVPLGDKPKAKGSDKLKYPSEEVIGQVKREASGRRIEVKIIGS